MAGPTTTGSIDAKLTVDDSDFKRGMTEAKAEAKEVGALEPSVKVDANVGPALAKLEEVVVAEKRLEAAERSRMNAAGALSVAEMRYEAIMTKSGHTDLQVAAAEEALARARRNDTAATEKSAAASAALNAVKAEAARKSMEQAAAEDAETESTKAGVKANRDRISGWQVLLALAPEILAASAPIVGAATGLAVGFGAMGLAGVLAFKGIKDAMVVGDGVGNQYAAGLQVLKTDMNDLAGTSANAMLSSFNNIVGDINNRMPFLTNMVSQGSAALGVMGGTALRGVLTGLQTMNPLIQAGEVELSKFVTWLFSFNGTSGFQDFISYSIENLPSVMHLLESLVLTAGHILAAFAPLGPPMIAVLSGISDWVSSFPLPVLAGVVTTATLIGPALKAAFAPGVSTLIVAVADAIGLTGVMANLAVPVVGILTALIAGIGVAAASSALGTTTATTAVQDYTNALKEDTDAIGEHVRAQAAKALSDAGAFDAARTLGIAQKTLTDAVLGNVDAINKVNDAVKAGKQFQNDWSQGVVDANTGIYVATQAQNDMGKAIDLVTGQIKSQTGAIDRSKQANDDLAAATNVQSGALQAQAMQYGTTVQALQAAKDAQDKEGQSTAATTLKMQLQNDAAGLLKMTLDGLNGKAISAAQAQNAFDSSLANMGDHIDKTGKKITFTTTSIGDMSAASVALRGQLNGQVVALQQVIEANGGLNNSTGEAKAQMEDMRKQIIANAVAHGVDETAVTNYIDKLMQIPASVPATQVSMDTSAAEAALAALTRHRTVEITAITTQVRGGGSPDDPSMTALNPDQHADGGEVLYRAGGGPVPFRPSGTDTVPAMLTPGEVVMKRASVQSLGLGNLLQANRTGQWPGQSGAGMPSTLTLVVDGREFTAYVAEVADGRVAAGMDGVARQIGGMRR